MQQNEQKSDKSKLAMQNDELQQITRQNDKIKTQDEKNDELCRKTHETTCNDFHTTKDVKKMRKQFSRRRSVV